MKPEGLYEIFDHIPTGIYIDTLLLIFTFVIDSYSRFLKRNVKIKKLQNVEI
jgi:hypothetical protein